MKGMLGKKLGMTAMFTPDGKYVPVTVLEIGPCVVTQIKSVETDGYDALQIGIGSKKESAVNKPLKGHYKKSGNRFFSTTGVRSRESVASKNRTQTADKYRLLTTGYRHYIPGGFLP